MEQIKRIEKAKALLEHPMMLGRALGFTNLTKLHDGWMRLMLKETTEDMTLQAHRGSYKTTCLCIAIAIMMIRYRAKNIIFLRKTDNDVTEVIKQVNRILSTNLMQDIYLALTGTRLEIKRANDSEITTTAYSAPRGAAQLLGIGIGGSLTGKHADIVITDDIVNLKDRQSHAERQRTKSAYQELQNIRNPGGRIINTGTPWHKEDCFCIMPQPLRYDCYQTGLLGAEKIDKLRKSMSPSLFAANYELRHIAVENALFSEAPNFTQKEIFLRDGFAHIDAAYGGQDYTALTLGQRIGDTLYMYGRLWHGHVDTILDAALAEVEKYMCAPVYCENNGDKGYLAKEIRLRGTPCRAYAQKANKYTKISTYLRKWWSNIIWLQGTDPQYIAQIMDYTEQAEHDDAPDSAACMCRLLDRRGYELQL